jgi:hypothetical protein
MSFSYLPTDIIHNILSYNENVKHRNGKYMGQISKSDKRYELLLKIPRTFYVFHPNYYYNLKVNDILTIQLLYINYSYKSCDYYYMYYFLGKIRSPYYTP